MMMWLAVCFSVPLVLSLLFLLHRRKTYSLKGKHVLVTGGSSGIGKSLAVSAIRKGASLVTLVARNKEKLEAVQKELLRLIPVNGDQKVGVISADVSDSSVIEKLAEYIHEMGEVDVLVNSAGIAHTGPMSRTSAKCYQDMLQINVLGSIFMTKAVVQSMMERKSGAIVFVSSMSGQVGLYGYTGYAASKFALRGLAETLQMEVKPRGVRVSICFPPDTDTPQLEEEVKQRDDILKALASYGDVYKPETIAKDVWDGVERGYFHITHGMDGFVMGLICTGMSPVSSLWDTITQVSLMGVLRIVGVFYLTLFNREVASGYSAAKMKLF